MLRQIAAAVAVIVVSSSFANAQTIYAPVQYQYGEGNHRYYYGGSDPAVLEMAERQRCLDEMTDFRYGTDRYNAAYVHYRLVGRLERVYSDCVPYVNARIYGYRAVDAANDAYKNVPTYFRKADLLRAAVAMPDGTNVVGAQAQPVAGDYDDRHAVTRPAIRPRAIIKIIPRSKPKTSDKQLTASAN
jgi:hypothetical protein